MAKKAYVGVGNVARKAKKIYIGVNGVARKVKKAYIGVNGVARLCFSSGELAYYGYVTPLSQGRGQLVATSLGSLCLFGGGNAGGGFSSIVDAYNTSLSRLGAPSLSLPVRLLASTTIGGHGLFGGGMTSVSTFSSYVCSYNTSLSMNTAPYLSVGRYDLMATSTSHHALFAGGSNNQLQNVVDAYDIYLTHTNPSAFNNTGPCLQGAGVSVGEYSLFGGGYNFSNKVMAYNASLTLTNPTTLSAGRGALASAPVGNYGLFVGGKAGSPGYEGYYTNVVDAYNTSLTRSNPESLSFSMIEIRGTTAGDFALFNESKITNGYDTSLTRIIPAQTAASRQYHAATYVGDYALFGGGMSNVSSVEAYSVM